MPSKAKPKYKLEGLKNKEISIKIGETFIAGILIDFDDEFLYLKMKTLDRENKIRIINKRQFSYIEPI